MEEGSNGNAPTGIVEMPTIDEYEDEAAQLANENPIFALIIGNNEYHAAERFKSLKGAVPDADSIEAVLRRSLVLKESQIISLRNATRQQMLDGFRRLEEITKGSEDPCMIIFYAGHGAQAPRPKGWEEYAADYDKIEMLCPSDLGVVGEDGRVVEGIPDRMVSALLGALAEKRGNNITLILDCCHSAGLNRDEEASDRISRSLRDPPPITAEANVIPPSTIQEPGEPTRGVRVALGFGNKYATSHVLLAACGRNKRAYESEFTGHGYFTHALIGFLRGKKIEAETYLSLMYNIRMPPWQTPHCMGVNADRPLFNRRGSRSDPSYIPCKAVEIETLQPKNEIVKEKNRESVDQLSKTLKKKDVQYNLFAGLAEGIIPGEPFDLYKTVPSQGEKDPARPFGMMVAANVKTTLTVLQRLPGRETPKKIPKVFYAKRIAWSNAPASIYCEDKALIESISKVYQTGATVKAGRVTSTDLVNDPTKASLILKVEGDNIYLERNDPVINAHIPSRFPATLRRDASEAIQRIISGWRHFDYHLHRVGRNEFPQVRMELHYLEPVDGDWSQDEPEFKPKGGNLLAEEPAHVVMSDEETQRPLGMTLYNDGDADVYPYLFYFDPTELTITPWSVVAEGAGDGQVDPPLLKHSKLAIGYGNGGASPFQFYFEGDRTKDIGFFKLFLSCSPANFRCLNQETSPFKRLETRGGEEEYRSDEDEEKVERARLEAEEELKKLYADHWGVKVATVIQSQRKI